MIAILLGTLLTSVATAPVTYPKAKLLIEPADLAKPNNFVILDVRGKAEYDQGHIPGALQVDGGQWAKVFGTGDDAKAWSQRIGVLGIDEKRTVIVYDENKSKDAARIWWILRYWGVEDVRILNGGWREWKSADRPVQTIAARTKALNFDAKVARARLASKDQLLQSLQSKSLQIVDARSEKEHCGIDLLENKRGGAIPGAKHLEWSQLVDDRTHRFKSVKEVDELFKKADIDVRKPTAAYCQSGGRAAVMAFALELMGGGEIANYYSSWGEWGNDAKLPIEKKP